MCGITKIAVGSKISLEARKIHGIASEEVLNFALREIKLKERSLWGLGTS